LRIALLGARTDPARHGFLITRSSSTAALKMLETLPKIIRA
jgi:hypothetical protein